MKEPAFLPKKSIDEYLDNNPLNQEAYSQLTDKNNKWFEVFEPLTFMTLLYESKEIIKANKYQPDSVITYLESIEPNQDKRYFLLFFLLEVMRLEHKGDSAIESCMKSIKERLWLPLEDEYKLANMANYNVKVEKPKGKEKEKGKVKVKVNVTISPYFEKWKAVEEQLTKLSPEEKLIYLEMALINLEREDLDIRSNEQHVFQEDRRTFAERIKLKIREIKLNSGVDKLATDKPKVKKKPGKPKAEIKTIENYISEIIENKDMFLKKLKEEFMDTSPKSFIYMLFCLDKMGLITFKYRKEVFLAFGEFFGGDYGSEINLTNTWKNPNDLSFLKKTEEIIENIVQESKSANH